MIVIVNHTCGNCNTVAIKERLCQTKATTDPHSMEYLAIALDLLQKHNLKKTKPRVAILRLFAETNEPISAYQIQEKIADQGINITTVYRTLEPFVAIGLIHHLASLNSYYRCDPQILNQKAKGHHSFAICNNCHSVNEFVDPRHSQHLANFTCHQHIQEVIGLCVQCSN